MSPTPETNSSPEPTPDPSLITENTPTPTPSPSPTPDGEPPEGQPEPKQPGQAPDDSPIVEPLTVEDITLPEGVEIKEELRDEFITLMNDKEMSPKDRANALVALQVKAAQAASEASSQAWTDMQTEWRDAVKADPEIGGEKLQPALGRIGKLINEFGSEQLSSVLDLTGAGNHVEVIKFLDKVAQKLTEGGGVPGLPTGQTVSSAQRLFPSMKG